MSDIVESLRQASLNQGDYRWKAADEIERLRAALEEIAGLGAICASDIAAITLRRSRARAALEGE